MSSLKAQLDKVVKDPSNNLLKPKKDGTKVVAKRRDVRRAFRKQMRILR
jgi:hypothetical protein